MSEVRIKPFKRVLVANRGEIAIRVFRALADLGITSVAIYSKEDKYAMFRTLANEAYELNPESGPIDAYLDIDTIIKIARTTISTRSTPATASWPRTPASSRPVRRTASPSSGRPWPA